MRENIPLSDPQTFATWARAYAGGHVQMVRTASAVLEFHNGHWYQRPAIRIDYAFDVHYPGLTRTYTYSEVCRVRDDGTIEFPNGSPYLLLQGDVAFAVTHPRSGSL